jgi:hypothetical protein
MVGARVSVGAAPSRGGCGRAHLDDELVVDEDGEDLVRIEALELRDFLAGQRLLLLVLGK